MLLVIFSLISSITFAFQSSQQHSPKCFQRYCRLIDESNQLSLTRVTKCKSFKNVSPQRIVALIPKGGASPPLSTGVLLGMTITLEVLATTCMKLATTNKAYYVGVALGYGLCFSIFPMVLRQMPLAVAYAIWSGAGTALTTLVSFICFGEPLTLRKVACILLIISGVIGLNLSGGGH
uniref:EamA domain-containing protein n=1 Tax=Aureoumbra lagunensis TaxID=44058 RepID=A0A7S3K3Q7_9STRA|mmetsp:Transcript_23213/g.30048  ORF Transcript_23213/g.30048 Transcript_23213/m.30048 type:complete len:178 (+) Transcript_23213:37-570(+)